MPTVMDIGKLIKAARGERKLSQSELSDRCGWGFSNSRISHYETGRRIPSVEDLIVIANQGLDMHVADLLDDGESRRGKSAATGSISKMAVQLIRLTPKRQALILQLVQELQE